MFEVYPTTKVDRGFGDQTAIVDALPRRRSKDLDKRYQDCPLTLKTSGRRTTSALLNSDGSSVVISVIFWHSLKTEHMWFL